jgi:hypothetical protein
MLSLAIQVIVRVIRPFLTCRGGWINPQAFYELLAPTEI